MKREKDITRKLFFSFLKIGTFTIGGGYAMLPIIEKELVESKQWLTKKDFYDMVVIAQTAPGILAMNIALLLGHRMQGRKGALLSSLATILPSFIIVLCLAMMVDVLKDNTYFNAALRGVYPVVVALIAVSAYNMTRSACTTITAILVTLFTVILIRFIGISPALLVIIAIVFGVVRRIIDKYRKREEK